MKIYKVKVNGKTYKVELESIDEIVSKEKPKLKEAKKEEKKTIPVTTGEGTPILAPIQGVLMDYKVKSGQAVKKGDVLLIIEAMKLENEVCAPRDGIVGELMVSKGKQVNAKDVLLTLK